MRKNTSRKGQISLEMLVLVSFMVIGMLVTTTYFMNKNYSIQKQKEYDLVSQINAKIQSEFQLAKLAETGYTRTFTIPSTVATDAGQKKVTVVLYKPRDPANNNTEIVVKVVPPLQKNLEAVTVAGKEIFGNLNNGNNTIVKTSDGIVVYPQKLPTNVPPLANDSLYIASLKLYPEGGIKLDDIAQCKMILINYNESAQYNIVTNYFKIHNGIKSPISGCSNNGLAGGSGHTTINSPFVDNLDSCNIRVNTNDLSLGDKVLCSVKVTEQGPTTASTQSAKAESEPVNVTSLSIEPTIQDITGNNSAPSTNYNIGYYTWNSIKVKINSGFSAQKLFKFKIVKEGLRSEYIECMDPSSCATDALHHGGNYFITVNYKFPNALPNSKGQLQTISCDTINFFSFNVAEIDENNNVAAVIPVNVHLAC